MSKAYPDFIAGEWPRSHREVIRVALQHYQGRQVLSVCAWYRDGMGEMRPGSDGITLGLAHLAPLLDALAETYREACARGYLDADNDDAVS